MFRHPELFAVALVLGSGAPVVAQTSIEGVHVSASQGIAPATAREGRSPRVALAVGFTGLNLQKVDADTRVGGSPAGLAVGSG
jgi:hypothetical protein